MYRLATSIVAAGACAMALPAQTAPQFVGPPQKFPRVAQFAIMPPAPAGRQGTVRAVRELGTKFDRAETAVCSIPLLEVPAAKNVEQMPTLRPHVENVSRIPSVKVPARPCNEERR
jgi:hypothetical protein